MNKCLYIFFCLIIFLGGCKTVSPENLPLDETRRISPVHKEMTDIPTARDLKLSKAYAEVNDAIINKDYNKALSEAWITRRIYHDLDYFSNLTFIEGFAFENVGLDSLAKDKYRFFLENSQKTYSGRFRGNEFLDEDGFIRNNQRNHAFAFINDAKSEDTVIFKKFVPKYYHDRYQPGYLTIEALYNRKKANLDIFLGRDYNKYWNVGVRLNIPLKRYFGAVVQTMFSKEIGSLTLGFPTQLYKSDDERLAFEFTPYFSLLCSDYKHPGDGAELFVDYGARLSAGYYLIPNLSIGAYYQYRFHNENNPYKTNSGILICKENEFDASVYYNLLKNISFKAGVKNKDIVAGFFLSGWEISYSINHNRFIFTTGIF